MTQAPPRTRAPRPGPRSSGPRHPPTDAARPVLDKLFQLHPLLFGAKFLPLKLGVFEDLMQRHAGAFSKEELKAALGQHVRSTRYLDAVAAGLPRHDLDGLPVEPVAPAHRLHAIVEVLRRRQPHARQDLQPWAVDRVVDAIEASGLDREAFLARIPAKDGAAQPLLEAAFVRLAERAARHEALRRAFAASGKPVAEFAQMYGLEEAVVQAALDAPASPEKGLAQAG